MDNQHKKLILFFSAVIGFLQDDRNFIGFYRKKELKSLEENVSLTFEKISRDIQQQSKRDMQKDIDKLIRMIQSKKIYFDLITDTDIKRKYKESYTLSKKNRDIICEHAMAYHCSKCTRNKKRCALRTAFQESDVPIFNDDDNKCPYDNS